MLPSINSFEEYQLAYEKSIHQPETFWAEIAAQFVWKKHWDKVLSWNFEDLDVRWFEGGQVNIAENCLDRHLATNGDTVALIFEPNSTSEKSYSLTYKELHKEVCKFANVLLSNGATKGSRVCIYMPNIPQAAIAMLACARIGAIHSVVFGGFSSNALADRLNDAEATILVTADGSWRGNKEVGLKVIADEAVLKSPSVKSVIVYKRTGSEVNFVEGRDQWWHLAMEQASEINIAVPVEAEDTLFILYTSGSTGKPKGVVHTTAGYMVYSAYTFSNVFQYQPKQIYWCTADVGWITGHSYMVYGPLLAGGTSLMFEGVPTFPDAGRFWEVIDKHQVNIFYTAPTAIRSLMAFGDEFPAKYKLDSLKVLGSVGEPINEEAWEWYFKLIGKERCPIADTYWQTETGGHLIAPIAHVTPEIPSFATLPLPGIQLVLVDNEGKELIGNDVEGNLCIRFPWPGMLRTTYGDHERCKQTYFSTYKGLYFTGDGAKRSENGYYRIMGRVDDVMNISGHRIGTAEVESAINFHDGIVESAVVGFPHDIKGQGIYAFVIPEKHMTDEVLTRKEIIESVVKHIGPIAKPDKILFVSGLPKTRSGKIMRRILRKIAANETEQMGDISTLLDPNVVEEIILRSKN
jgi:acetyl-CoA synthetase